MEPYGNISMLEGLLLAVDSCNVLLSELYIISILLSCDDLGLVSYYLVMWYPQNVFL
jgi:hypothetical protein